MKIYKFWGNKKHFFQFLAILATVNRPQKFKNFFFEIRIFSEDLGMNILKI